MTKLNKNMGNKASNEEKIEDLNKSKTFRAVERICRHYLKLKKVIYEEVKSKDMYITHGEMYKEAEEG